MQHLQKTRGSLLQAKYFSPICEIPVNLPSSVRSSKLRIPQVHYLPLLRKHRGCGGILPISVQRSLSGRSLRTGLGVSSNPSLSTFNRRSRLRRDCRSKIPARSQLSIEDPDSVGTSPMPLFHGSRIAWV